MPAILNLPQLTTSTGNIVFPVVDVNVSPNVTKKATLSQIKDYIGATVIAPQGYTGSQGFGYTGSTGAGYIGSRGSIGYVGSSGAGYTGSQGAVGYIGSASTELGYTGSVGYTGSIGAPITIAGSTSTFSALPNPYLGVPGNLYITIDDGFANVWDGGTWTSLQAPVQGPTGYTGSASAGYIGSAGYVGSQGTFNGATTDRIVTFNTETSTSVTTGSIVAYGGVGIAKDLNVGGYVKAASQIILPVHTTSTLATVSTQTGGFAFLLNAPNGSQPVYYNGANWYTISQDLVL